MSTPESPAKSVGMHSPATEIQCKGCGVSFVPRRAWATFCSPRCRTRYHKSRSITAKLKALEERVERLEREHATGLKST